LTNRPDRNIGAAKRLVAADKEGRLAAVVKETIVPTSCCAIEFDGDVVVVSERLLPLERGSNFRDVGGYKTLDGKHVRWGSSIDRAQPLCFLPTTSPTFVGSACTP